MNAIRRLAGPLLAIALVNACAAADPAASTSQPPPSSSPTADPTASNGDPGSGSEPANGGLTVPKPGQRDARPVRMDGLSATVDGRHVIITATWTSGVEPCYVLDTIIVDTDGPTYTVTLREGHGPDDVACIEIAQMKSTRIDLGELEPGTYTVVDGAGGPATIEVVVT